MAASGCYLSRATTRRRSKKSRNSSIGSGSCPSISETSRWAADSSNFPAVRSPGSTWFSSHEGEVTQRIVRLERSGTETATQAAKRCQLQLLGCDISNVDTHVADWLMLIHAEHLEIPGLSLTKQQVERLWGLDAVTSDALLAALVDVKCLRRTVRDGYLCADGV